LILDSSAIIAIITDDADGERMRSGLARDVRRAVGAPTLLEVGVVLVSRFGASGSAALAAFMVGAGTSVIPFGERHWPAALDAFARFGKGRHPAALNLGDCMAYAVAKLSGEPLLCTGDDFARTDLTLVE
jgi:ribonuclease VapC